MKTDKTLIQIYAGTYGWFSASVQPGNCDGSLEVIEGYQIDGCLPFKFGGSWREREALIAELVTSGMINLKGSTRDRRAGLTWLGVCRAVALTVGASEIPLTIEIMKRIAAYSELAGGPDVSPSGSVPEYLLESSLGPWWSECRPHNQEMMITRSRLFCRCLPALCMRWLTVGADCYGRRWFSITGTGKDVLSNSPLIPEKLPKPRLTDYYLQESDHAWNKACQSKQRDTNAVHLPLPVSRWWVPKAEVTK